MIAYDRLPDESTASPRIQQAKKRRMPTTEDGEPDDMFVTKKQRVGGFSTVPVLKEPGLGWLPQHVQNAISKVGFLGNALSSSRKGDAASTAGESLFE